MPIKNSGEKGAWTYPGTAQIVGVPLYSQERLKLRTSNFVGIFISLIETKDHKNVGNSSRGRSQGVPNIHGTHIGRIARSSLRQHSFLV